jgi:hypothetical protein
MNTKASHQTRIVRKALGELPVTVSTMRGFRDTAVEADDVETASKARELLQGAGFKVSVVVAYKALGFHVYVTH